MAFYAQKDPRIRSRFDLTASEASKEEEEKPKILEDYLLDDEMPKSTKGPKTPPMPTPAAAAAAPSWQPVVPGAENNQQPPQHPTQPPPAGYPGYPPNFDQSGQHYAQGNYRGYYNQYDYSQQQQQQYPGYNYYPGYGPPPTWAPAPILPPTAVPPPTIPDLSKPPPVIPAQTKKSWSPPPRREERARERSRERSRERERSRDRERERDRGRERERREKERPHSREKDRSRDKTRDKERTRERAASRDESTESHRKLVADVVHQKDQYVKQYELLKRELKVLKDQQKDLMQDNVKESSQILKENLKLQEEVRKKLESISNLVEKLDQVLGKKDKRKKKKSRSRSRSRDHKKSSQGSTSSDNESLHKLKETDKSKPKYNLKFFDPEEYWCRVCNIFPDNAKEYLHHLHSQEHKHAMADINLIEAAWHDHNPERPRCEIEGAPERRVPIRGLQFLIAATAWYCKLCHKWMGDLHCTSLHLKSDLHINNVEAYFEDDPEWETTWRKDREKALKQAMQEAKAKKSKPAEPEDVSTSSKFTPRSENSYQDKVVSSPKLDEENAKSIRVAMRNQPKMGPAMPPNHPLSHPVSKPSSFWESVPQPSRAPDKKEAAKDDDEGRNRRKRSRSTSPDEDRKRGRGRRSHSHERRRDRRSRSKDRRRRRSRSKSSTPKKEPRKWVDIPSSPPPYVVRKVEEKMDWKLKKKPTPTVPRALPKNTFGFIGKMPVLKAKKKAENEAQQSNVSGDPYEYYAYNAYIASNNEAAATAAADENKSVDMEVDNGDDNGTNGSEATPKMEASRRIEDLDEMTLLGIDPEDVMAQIM